MLGFLLARAGVDVVVLEKHADFLRDFRGDTIHPSTMQIMHELGMLDEFLKLPHQRVSDLTAQFGDERLRVADFSSLPVAAPFIAMMPQWDFLHFLVELTKICRIAGYGTRRSDGCIVVPFVAATGRHGADARASRRRPRLHHAQSWGLLAMRLCDPEGIKRTGARGRP